MKYITSLISYLGSAKVSINETELERHSHDESFHPAVKPNVVCVPENTEDIVHILYVANEYSIPITPFGIGSGLEGQAIPLENGISVSFEKMASILEFSPDDLTITVQPGITRTAVNEKINRFGLMFPIDPGADASIGGMAATNASGTTAVKYGSVRDQILNLEVVLPNGTIIHTGTKAKKSSSGYHLNGLFAGSEGTLGIISAITLRLHGIPEYTQTARCTFSTIETCAQAAQTILMSGIPVLRMELVDQISIQTVNEYGDYNFPEAHSLFLEFSGNEDGVKADVRLTRELMNDLGCEHWEEADTPAQSNELWRARHEMAYAYRHKKGVAIAGADVCVPISQLPSLVGYARVLIEESGLKGGILGHIGDGNFHTLLSFNSRDASEKAKAEFVNEKLTNRAISLGGTCTGEHGVGIGKRKFQQAEHGSALELMKQINDLIDPKQIMNPGKIL
ncbi:FAD-binding oxidoreductase [Sporosarcina ureae]|uniref:FAD-binding oxidoreductase n=1 Tax=Sporosarcina ureae TaxID=1571 RepID=UPI0028B190E1|nr:FAD-linked oxidase C-terminal domain-containing protein [Sporosarcina ureae]